MVNLYLYQITDNTRVQYVYCTRVRCDHLSRARGFANGDKTAFRYTTFPGHVLNRYITLPGVVGKSVKLLAAFSMYSGMVIKGGNF